MRQQGFAIKKETNFAKGLDKVRDVQKSFGASRLLLESRLN